MLLTATLLASALAAEPPATATLPVAADALVAAQRVHLETPWTYTWTAEPRAVADAVLIAVRVDADLARPRQTWTPVLYAGDAAVEILAGSDDNTCVVGLVPADDLASRTLYWGPQRLPEQVTAALGRDAAEGALQAGASPLGEAADRLTGKAVNLPELAREGKIVEALLDRCAR